MMIRITEPEVRQASLARVYSDEEMSWGKGVPVQERGSLLSKK